MDFESTFSPFRISASALEAERQRMRVIANNLANANVTRTPGGEPYCKRDVVFQSLVEREAATGQDDGLGGVRVARVARSTAPFRTVFRPGHPDADEDGMVLMPNVEPVTEMVDMITASRSYQANLAVLKTFKEMMLQTLRLGR
ncbi:MAG: flagellar basal body rod protein FlgC [Candidatus Brocadiia bacterium]